MAQARTERRHMTAVDGIHIELERTSFKVKGRIHLKS